MDSAAAPSLAEADKWRDGAELALDLRQLTSLAQVLETLTVDIAQPVTDITKLDIPETDPAHTLALALIDEDTTLREQQIFMNQRLTEIRQRNDEIDRATKTLDDRYATAMRVADFAGDSET